jgi:hypothetical protein
MDKNDVRVPEKPPERVNVLNYVKLVLAFFVFAGSLSAVTYLNYTSPNVTGIGSAFDYSQTALTTATGSPDAFGLMILGTMFVCFYIIGSRYTQERALVYATFMVTLVAFLMVSGNFLDPKWLILCIIALLAAVYLANRVG